MPQVITATFPAWTAMAWVFASSRVENKAKHSLWVHINPEVTAVDGVARTGMLENKGIVCWCVQAVFFNKLYIPGS